MARPIDLRGFEARFAADPDPWGTFRRHDEAVKRRAVLAALGPRPHGRMLELGSGNGSNSVALARRALRLDACDGSASACTLTRQALAHCPRARVHRLALPGRFPRPAYDAVVIAELLYYLAPRDMARLARAVARSLRPGGRLVLAHHRVPFDDAAQPPAGIHARFLAATGRPWHHVPVRRTGRWRVLRAVPRRPAGWLAG